ncbi:MAG: FAD-dependent oxidoreductase, partial [Sedimentibacter sp.]
SSDFEGQSAARIQPTCAGMGQAIGTAIYLALKNNCPLTKVSREEIENQLLKISNN